MRFKWDYDKCKEVSKKYKTRTELLSNESGVYRYLSTHGLLDEFYPTNASENKHLLKQGKKRCRDCEQVLDLSKYDYINKNVINKGYRSRCKECFKQNSKDYWQNNRRIKENGRIEKKKLWEQGIKQCTKCKEIKSIETDFYTRPNGIIVSKCRSCMHEYNIIAKPRKEGGKIWKLKLREEGKKWCNRCGEIKLLNEFSNLKSREHIDGKATFCRKCKSETDKKYKNNPKYRNVILQKKREEYHTKKHTAEYIEYYKMRASKRNYSEEYKRVRSDELRLFKTRVRSRVNTYFKKNRDWIKKDTKSIELLGVDYFVAKEFIERQFLKGMTWENYGTDWHIDHVIPLDAAGRDLEMVKKLCYYQNLMPMWWKDNLAKGFKVPNICTLWKNPVVPYKEYDVVIVPKYNGIVGDYKLQINPGERYGMVTIIDGAEKKNKKRMVKCKCDCGNVIVLGLNGLRQGKTRSCGCLQKMKIKEYMNNKKLIFTEDEINIIKDFVNNNKKAAKVSDEFVSRFPNNTRDQVQRYIRYIRNGEIKKLNQ
jgi:hypothetical protein